MTKTIRENVLKSAVHFLRIPEVSKSSLAKKVAFLESKGLTEAEIQKALKHAASDIVRNSNEQEESTEFTFVPPVPPEISTVEMQEPVDWKRYLTTVGAVGSVSYGLYYLIKKYSSTEAPSNGPSASKAELREIDVQYQAASSSLLTIRKDTLDMVQCIKEQKDEVKARVEDMSELLSQLKSQDSERHQELHLLRQELRQVKSIIPKIVENQRESQNTMLAELQNELKSLKDMLLNAKTIRLSKYQPSQIEG